MAQIEEFMFQNVAYRPTVYITGIRTIPLSLLLKLFFCPRKVEKIKKSKSTFFFLTASTAQMAQTEEFMFQIVAYRPTVYKTGLLKFSFSEKATKICAICLMVLMFTK